MQRNEVLEFLDKIDLYLDSNHSSELNGKFLPVRIIGKCALLLAGMSDPVGTVDLDWLEIQVDSHHPSLDSVIDGLISSFGREQQRVHGYYLQFVSEAMLFLPGRPTWVPLTGSWGHLQIRYLDPCENIASKCFSAFSQATRKKDLKDVTEALDQRLVNFPDLLRKIDQIFDANSMDARADRFPKVHAFVTERLIPEYGDHLRLTYTPAEE